jgi:hypothetical protein
MTDILGRVEPTQNFVADWLRSYLAAMRAASASQPINAPLSAKHFLTAKPSGLPPDSD